MTLKDKIRDRRAKIGVIGLGWFGEIHAETIVGIPNLELAALCTRTRLPNRDRASPSAICDLAEFATPAMARRHADLFEACARAGEATRG